MVEPVAAVRDGMGLADREIVADSSASGIGNKQQYGSADSGHTVHKVQLEPSLVRAAPSKKGPAGRPAATKHHMNSHRRELDFVLSVGFKATRVQHVRREMMRQRLLGSLLAVRTCSNPPKVGLPYEIVCFSVFCYQHRIYLAVACCLRL